VKIYTRRGDRGETDLFGGPRVGKDDLRVEAYGAVDELNAVVGMAAAESAHEDVAALCRDIQNALFDLGAYLATPEAKRREKSGVPEPDDEQISRLEDAIDRFEEELPALRNFVLPGGSAAAAAFHLARTVCRRAERRCVSLGRDTELDAPAIGYINRLSDLFFVLARLENARAGRPDVEWTGRKR
jgi:cob(I)alamin adenosyltransferase